MRLITLNVNTSFSHESKLKKVSNHIYDIPLFYINKDTWRWQSKNPNGFNE